MSEVKVGLRDFKTHVGRYLRRVQAGESLVITSQGQPVGRLIPVPSPADAAGVEARLAALIEEGLIAWNGERFQPEEPALEGPAGFSLTDVVLEEREAAIERLL